MKNKLRDTEMCGREPKVHALEEQLRQEEELNPELDGTLRIFRIILEQSLYVY